MKGFLRNYKDTAADYARASRYLRSDAVRNRDPKAAMAAIGVRNAANAAGYGTIGGIQSHAGLLRDAGVKAGGIMRATGDLAEKERINRGGLLQPGGGSGLLRSATPRLDAGVQTPGLDAGPQTPGLDANPARGQGLLREPTPYDNSDGNGDGFQFDPNQYPEGYGDGGGRASGEFGNDINAISDSGLEQDPNVDTTEYPSGYGSRLSNTSRDFLAEYNKKDTGSLLRTPPINGSRLSKTSKLFTDSIPKNKPKAGSLLRI
jgi:hypothetical protein